jgi:ATP-dependent DNA ligase
LIQERGSPLSVAQTTVPQWLTYPEKKTETFPFHLISETIPECKEKKTAVDITTFLWSLKHDGIRMALSKEGGITRNGLKVHLVLPLVFDNLPEGDVYDVELIYVGPDGPSNHNRVWKVLNGPKNPASEALLDVRIFDLLQTKTPTPVVSFQDRYAYLCRTIPSSFMVLQTPVESWTGLCDQVYKVLEVGGEGLVVRSREGVYLQGKRRNTNAFKMKTDFRGRMRTQAVAWKKK